MQLARSNPRLPDRSAVGRKKDHPAFAPRYEPQVGSMRSAWQPLGGAGERRPVVPADPDTAILRHQHRAFDPCVWHGQWQETEGRCVRQPSALGRGPAAAIKSQNVALDQRRN